MTDVLHTQKKKNKGVNERDTLFKFRMGGFIFIEK